MNKTQEITNAEDIIDSRDVIERINYLEIDEGSLDELEKEELANLRSLAEEAESSPDWKYGEALIRDSYFQEYAEQLAEDIGAIQKGATWPNNCIDWEEAAEQLQQDYMCVDFDGVKYWIRS